ncbi:MAG TPA: beta-N-acetylhexosaminidase, partial [Ktedonobacteraceae bacterium]|nr:beta-N-acetylhexosaminidase [Ktedonobacteraceae bacterium]
MLLRYIKKMSLIIILLLSFGIFQVFLTYHIPVTHYGQAQSRTPITIPSLKQWNAGAGAGSYTFSRSSHIVLDPTFVKQLTTTAAVFSKDLHALTGLSIPAVTGSSKSGDIYLSLNAHDKSLGSEGYLLTIADRVTISAQEDAGVFYGTRTILQLLKQSHTIPEGIARDRPDYPERGLMVDVGRKYYSVPWLENHIRDLAYLKMNYLHLHFSDNLGFRLQSSSHP